MKGKTSEGKAGIRKWQLALIGILIFGMLVGMAGAENILWLNSADGGEFAITDGFLASSGVTLTATNSTAWQGNYSIGATTPHLIIGEGIYTDPATNITPGQQYTASTYLKGNGTVKIYLYEYASNGTYINNVASSTITLTSTFTRYSINKTFGTSAGGAKIQIRTAANETADFYVDGVQLESGGVATAYTDPIFADWAYGDSFTAASDTYILQMVATHDPNASVYRNTDGSGKTSIWGLANVATHPLYGVPRKSFTLFGANDWNYTTGEGTCENLIGIADSQSAAGSIPYILINTVFNTTRFWNSTYSEQWAKIYAIEACLDARNRSYIKAFDAVDSIPGNGIPDEINESLMRDVVHPNTEGQRLIGEYVWAHLATGTAAFTANATSGTAPLSVQFNDTTSLDPTLWHWDFGDGNTSTVQNATHTFGVGNWSVNLTATNAAGSNTSASQWINVTSGADPNPYSWIKFKAGESLSINNGTPYTATVVVRNITNTTNVIGNISFNQTVFAVNNLRINTSSIPSGLVLDSYDINANWINFSVSRAAGIAIPYPNGAAILDLNVSYVSYAAPGYSVLASFTNASKYYDSTNLTYWPFNTLSSGYAVAGKWGSSPGSVIKYKSLTSSTQINNQTPYTETVVIQNITNTTSVRGNLTWNTAHVGVSNLRVNTSQTAGLSLISSSINSTGGFANFVVNKSGGIPIPTSSTAILDFDITYTKYISPGSLDNFSFGSSQYETDGTYYTFGSSVNYSAIIGTWGPITANFTGSPTLVAGGFPVTFTDNSFGYPSAYSWSFGDGNTSSVKNPTYTYSSIGLYTVSETAYMSENASVTNTLTRTNYINVTTAVPASPVANFTGTPTTVSVGSSVQFNDTSTGIPTSWSWDFGDTFGSTLQNPVHAYSSAGNYTVNLTVTNGIGSNTTSKINYIWVKSGFSGYTQQDLVMDPLYTLTLNFVDSSTNLPIPIVRVVNAADGTSVNTPTGTYTGTFGYSTVVLYLYSDGYQSKTVSYIMTADRVETVQMTAATTQSQNTNIIYTQHQVRLRVLDLWANPLKGITITASYVNSTLPGNNATFLEQAFGVSASVAETMMNSGMAMQGITATDGAQVFTMFPSLTYSLSMVNSTAGVSCQKSLAPEDNDYILYCPTSSQSLGYNTTATQLAKSYVWLSEPNKSYVTANYQYQDPLGLTTDLFMNLTCKDNGTVFWSHDYGNPGTSLIEFNYTIPNVRGMTINYGMYPVRSG